MPWWYLPKWCVCLQCSQLAIKFSSIRNLHPLQCELFPNYFGQLCYVCRHFAACYFVLVLCRLQQLRAYTVPFKLFQRKQNLRNLSLSDLMVFGWFYASVPFICIWITILIINDAYSLFLLTLSQWGCITFTVNILLLNKHSFDGKC